MTKNAQIISVQEKGNEIIISYDTIKFLMQAKRKIFEYEFSRLLNQLYG